VLYRIHL